VYVQFRFADFWDVLMIIFGFICACLSGLALPGHMILFGRVINNFVYHNTAINQTDNGTISERINSAAGSMDTSCSDFIRDNPSFIADRLRNGSDSTLLCGDEAQSIFGNVLNYACDPDSQLRDTIGLFSIYYILLATATLIAVFFATVFWNVSAYRQTRRIRQAFYHSILRQEIGWFDVNEASELSTRLAE
jgi:ABC-type multidrug transport system fused ATPase/permease subunit